MEQLSRAAPPHAPFIDGRWKIGAFSTPSVVRRKRDISFGEMEVRMPSTGAIVTRKWFSCDRDLSGEHLQKPFLWLR